MVPLLHLGHRSAMHIIFIGPPGAGKGTQSVRLAKHLQVPHLSTGDMLRKACQQKSEIGILAAEAMGSGQLVSDELVEQVVIERLKQPDCRNGCILDGFPRTVPQADALDRWLAKQGQALLVALALQVDQKILLDRLSSRGRQDDDRGTVIERLRQYDRLTHPLLDYYRQHSILQGVDGIGSEDEVFARIQEIIASLVAKKSE